MELLVVFFMFFACLLIIVFPFDWLPTSAKEPNLLVLPNDEKWWVHAFPSCVSVKRTQIYFARSAGAVEYTDCFSVEG